MRRLVAILSAALLCSGVSGAHAAGSASVDTGCPTATASASPRLDLARLKVGKLQTGRLRLAARKGTVDEAPAADAVVAAGKNTAKKKESSCDVIEFHATKTGAKSVDEKLGKWKSELDQPPLSAFDTFKVTGQKNAVIAIGGTSTVQITANLTLLFKGFVSENDKDRLQLEVTIDNAKGKRMYRSTTTQDSGASQILSAGKSGDANVFFVVTCTGQ